jgi:hypothetical protein
VTTSEDLIARVEELLGEVPVIQELIREYRIAVAQALRLETTVHQITKPQTRPVPPLDQPARE